MTARAAGIACEHNTRRLNLADTTISSLNTRLLPVVQHLLMMTMIRLDYDEYYSDDIKMTLISIVMISVISDV